jgi:hypothetical protein
MSLKRLGEIETRASDDAPLRFLKAAGGCVPWWFSGQSKGQNGVMVARRCSSSSRPSSEGATTVQRWKGQELGIEARVLPKFWRDAVYLCGFCLRISHRVGLYLQSSSSSILF